MSSSVRIGRLLKSSQTFRFQSNVLSSYSTSRFLCQSKFLTSRSCLRAFHSYLNNHGSINSSECDSSQSFRCVSSSILNHSIFTSYQIKLSSNHALLLFVPKSFSTKSSANEQKESNSNENQSSTKDRHTESTTANSDPIKPDRPPNWFDRVVYTVIRAWRYVTFPIVFFIGGVLIIAGIQLATISNPYYVNWLTKRFIESPGAQGLNGEFLFDQLEYMVLASIWTQQPFLPIRLTEPDAVSKIIDILLDPSPNSPPPLKLTAMGMLASLCTMPEYKERIARVPGISKMLLRATIHPHKEIAALSIMCLKEILDENPENLEEFFAQDGLRTLSRCARASAPDVASSATEAMAVVLPYLPSDIKKRFKLSADECQSLWHIFANLGAAYTEQGSHAMSKLAFESALKFEPNQPFLYSAYAAELNALGNHKEAAEALKKALSIDSSNLEAVFEYYKTLRRMGKWDDKTRQELIRTLGNCVEQWGRIVLRVRDSPELLPPEQPDLSPVLSAAYNLLMRTCEESSRLDLAIAKAQDWALKMHTDAVSHFHYGRLLLKAQYYSMALQQFDESIERDPSRIEPYYLKSLCLYKLQRFDDAADSLQKAKEQYQRQKLQLINPQQKFNNDSYSEISQHVPSYVVPLSQTSSVDLPQISQLEFQIERNRGNLNKALQSVEEYLRMKSSDCGMYLHSGVTRQQIQQTNEAFVDYTTAVQCFKKQMPLRSDRDKHLDQHPTQRKIMEALNKFCSENCKNVDDKVLSLCQELDQFNK